MQKYTGFIKQLKLFYLNFSIFLAAIVSSTPLLAAEIHVRDGWQVYHDNSSEIYHDLHHKISTYDDPTAEHTATYKGTFELSPLDWPQSQPAFMVLPPTWVNNSIRLNGQLLTPMGSGFSGHIYQYQIVNIPPQLLKSKNQVTVQTKGPAFYSGFRDDTLIVSNQAKTRSSFELFNLFFNDIHYFFIMFSLLLAMALIGVSRALSSRKPFLFLIYGIVGTLPNYLLTTGFYGFIGFGGLLPFKIQLSMLSLAWPSLICFYLLCNSRQIGVLTFVKRLNPHLFLAIPSIFLLLAALAPFNVFMGGIYAYFLSQVILSIAAVFFMNKEGWLTATYSFSLFMFYHAIVEDITHGNMYFIVYGWSLLYGVGVLTLLREISDSYHGNRTLNDFAQNFMPTSIFRTVEHLIREKTPFKEILPQVSGKKNLATILVDICDWGRLNSYSETKIPSAFISSARKHAFTTIEEKFTHHGLELIKTDGDKMKFCCGLDDPESKSPATAIANNSLEAIQALLDHINTMNAELRDMNLPIVELKISATFGICDFGIEKFAARCQFDTQGHYVNMAYRMESAMDQEFYSLYGRNVALISTTLTGLCDRVDLLSRFAERWDATDKHGFTYECFVGRQEARDISLRDFSKAAFSLFKPNSGDSPIIPLAAGSAKKPLDQRSSVRDQVYLGENLRCTLLCQSGQIEGEVIDHSDGGVGILLKRDQVSSSLETNQLVPVRFDFADQSFESNGSVKSCSPFSNSSGEFFKVGLMLLEGQRKSAERFHRRFSCPANEIQVAAYAETSFSFKNQLDFKVLEFSSKGMKLLRIGDGGGLMPGLQLNIHVGLPFVGNIAARVEIRHITNSSGHKQVGVEVVDSLEKFQSKVACYLVRCLGENITNEELRETGFVTKNIRSVLRSKYCNNHEDFQKILNLRLLVWQSSSAEDTDVTLADMEDPFDKNSRHMMFFVQEKLIGACRVVFNKGNMENTEHSRYGAHLPDWLSEKKFVEFSRVMIDPAYRGSDLFVSILYHMGRVTIESNHEYVLMSCSDSLLSYYERFGFKKIGSFRCKDEENSHSKEEWNLALCNLSKAIGGDSFLPVGWNIVFKGLHKQLNDQSVIQSGFISGVNQKLLDLTKPIIDRKLEKIRSRSKKKAG